MRKLFYTGFCERCSAKNLEPEAVLTTRILYLFQMKYSNSQRQYITLYVIYVYIEICSLYNFHTNVVYTNGCTIRQIILFHHNAEVYTIIIVGMIYYCRNNNIYALHLYTAIMIMGGIFGPVILTLGEYNMLNNPQGVLMS